MKGLVDDDGQAKEDQEKHQASSQVICSLRSFTPLGDNCQGSTPRKLIVTTISLLAGRVLTERVFTENRVSATAGVDKWWTGGFYRKFGFKSLFQNLKRKFHIEIFLTNIKGGE
jgi:hypothetical protein